MQINALEGGFVNPPIDAAHSFRAILRAMARPGTIETITGSRPPAPLSIASGALILTLCDPETPVFLGSAHDVAPVHDWITFHTGAPLVGASQAHFAIGFWPDLPLAEFSVGTSEYPDRSATLIVETAKLIAAGATLRGPGIERESQLNLPDIKAFQGNASLFPRGCDFFFTCGDRLAGLPRSTKVS
ncbi:MAG: phosphonate C-P lyase system protein PhnH [Sedimentitalea sp.]